MPWGFLHPTAGMEHLMNDKKQRLKPYIYGMLAGFGAIGLSIILFFVIFRFDGFGSAISKLTSILMPFIYGAVIAYLLKPVCNCIENFLLHIIPQKAHRIVEPITIMLTMLFGVLVVYALVMMIVPQLVTSIITLYHTVQRNLDKFADVVNTLPFIEDNQTLSAYIEQSFNDISKDLDSLETWVTDTFIPSAQNVLTGVGAGVWNAVLVIKNLLIGLIVAVYLLASRKRFARQAKMILYSILPTKWADLVVEEILYADKMFGGFINGKILDSAIIGILCYIVCLIVKFPSALLVSVIVGVTNVIPFFGPFIGAIPATLLILIQDPIKALWFVLFVFILQQIDGNVIGPKILGNTTGLSSFWVLFAILLFGGIWGFVGMIIGVPLFAVIYDIIKKLVIHGLKRHQQVELYQEYHDVFGDSCDGAPQPVIEAPVDNTAGESK